MNVIEIFDSIDGEGVFAGELATFIRLSGCNLACKYCDTGYALKAGSGTDMSIDEILMQCKEIGNKHITLTGGEPLIHEGVYELVSELSGTGFIVNIETNGSCDISRYTDNSNVIITLDYKTEGSGESGKMLLDNWDKLRECDVLKIVCYAEDLNSVEELLTIHATKAHIFLSPVYGKIAPATLVEFLKVMRDKHNYKQDIRVQLQLHKFIWNPDKRGV
jgi:7-carboxy-7-deazaguanine synthase